MKKRHVIIDCDPGHDDAIALLLALASDKLVVRGITTVSGNQTVDKTTINTLKILELTNNTHIPIAKGMQKSLMGKIQVADDVHGEGGMDGPELPYPKLQPIKISAAEFIANTIEKSKVQISIIATGPLTNIAVFILSYPHLIKKVECISIMGGSAFEGNRTPTAEFNIWNDPEAAKIVMNSGIPLYLHGLDVTHKAYIKKDEIELFRERKGLIFQFVADLLDFFSICYIDERELSGCPMHDACAVAFLIDETLFNGSNAFIDINLDGMLSRGSCIIDFRTLDDISKRSNGKVLMEVERERFLELILESCEKLEERITSYKVEEIKHV